MTVTFFTDSFKSKIAGHYKGHFANELYPSRSALPGEREYQGWVFWWTKCRNSSFELQGQIVSQGGSRGDPSHPWPAGPPQGLGNSPLQRGQSQAGRAGSRERMLWSSPECHHSQSLLLIAPLSRARWGGKALIPSRQGLRHGLCAQTAGQAQPQVNLVREFPWQSTKPTEPRKYPKAGSSGWLTGSFYLYWLDLHWLRHWSCMLPSTSGCLHFVLDLISWL